MTIVLPNPGQEPWDATLNTALSGLDSRLMSVEASGGGGGGGADPYSDWYTGRHWYALGTSLTFQNFYTGPLATLSGMELHNLGANSGQLCNGGASGGNGYIWNQMLAIPTDAEVITIETSNDWRLSSPPGTVADPEQGGEQVSFYGALKAAFAWIMTNRPAARLFTFTNYTDNFPNTYPNFYGTNAHGKYYWEYNDIVRRVADIYGVPLIEVARDAGLNYFTAQWFTSDGLHLNTLGGTRYAEFVWSRIRTMGWLDTRPTAPGGITNVAVTGVTINQGSAISIAPGGTQQFNATVAPANATNKGVSWASSNTAAVTIDGLGLAHGIANGTSNITCTTTDGGKVATCVVTVATAAVTGVDVTPASTSVGTGATTQLVATVLPTNAGNKNVTWQSSDPTKVTVNSTGLITGVAVGTATITCTTQQGSFTDTCVVTVAAAAWTMTTQTAFRQSGSLITGLTQGDDSPTYTDTPGGKYGVIILNNVGDNAVEFTVQDAAQGGAWVLGCSVAGGDFVTVNGISRPLNIIDHCSSFGAGAYFDVGHPPTPTPLYPTGWGNNVTYRFGRIGTRVKCVRVDAGNNLVTMFDIDLDANFGGAHIPRYEQVDLGVITYSTPGSFYTLPINCKTGTWSGA